MHAKGPLQADDGSLHTRQKPQRQQKGQRQPKDKMNPKIGLPNLFNDQHQGNNNVPHNENCEIGWRVVCPLVVQFRMAGTAFR